jgi:hypothetical protein
MTSKRELVAVIWLAIVMIAVQLVPAAALAHGGHAHLHGAGAAVTHDRTEGDAHQLKAEHTGAVAQAQTADISRDATSGACNDCCCASGFSCCAPAILAEPILGLPSPLKALKIEQPAASLRAGIDPEALPKPPKSFT